MAKWEKNTRWSKINFLIFGFFFFYWINMSVKDNEWPLKCFRGNKYPDTDPWMPICWKDKEKQIFCINFSKSFVIVLTFIIRICFYEICYVKQCCLRVWGQNSKKYEPTSLFTYLFYLSIFWIRPYLYSISTFFGRIWTAWDYHQKIVLCMMIKGIYGFACVLLRLGPLLDGQSRLVYKKVVVVTKFLIFWIWYLIFEIKQFICIFLRNILFKGRIQNARVSSTAKSYFFFFKEKLEQAIIDWVCHFSGIRQFWFEGDGIQTDPPIRVLASIDVNYMENNQI